MSQSDPNDLATPRFVPPTSHILNQVAKVVPSAEIETSNIQTIIDVMLDLARGEQGSPAGPTMVGLAAPQIGIAQRIIIVDVNANGRKNTTLDFRAYINPEIITSSTQSNLNREGCYSTGHVCGIVERPTSVTLKALDRSGKPVREAFTGFPARIFQHEVDHLNGIRFPDRITDDQNLLRVEADQFADFREHWRTWPHKCSRATWQAIKVGTQDL